MPDKWLLEQLAGTPPKFDGYSSYHLHKVLEELEVLEESASTDRATRDAVQILIPRLRAWLLRRFRAQLDQRHEEELMEDWNWSRHED